MIVPNQMDSTENTYVLIPNGRIYKAALKGPNPEGMTAWCDRRVFARKGYKVTGCLSTYNIQCVPLDPNDEFDMMIINRETMVEKSRIEIQDIHWSIE
jgi:hypothetical protein